MPRISVSLFFLFLVVFAACSDGGGGASSEDAPDVFAPDPPRVYVAKVKNILVGLPPTDAEVQAVEADPTRLEAEPKQLRALIAGWMTLPQYQAKMLRFFELAFQQTQVSFSDFADQTYPGNIALNSSTQPLIVQNASESFARTVLELIAEGQPLNAAMTTQRFMMTPALMELYVFLDQWQVNDDGTFADGFNNGVKTPPLAVTFEASQGPIPIGETLDPTSPNYMHWYNHQVGTSTVPGCAQDPIVFPTGKLGGLSMHQFLYGSLPGHASSNGGPACPIIGGDAQAPQLTGDDFTSWKMVSIRQPAAGEKTTTAFYDLPSLRNATELVLNIPRVGFFSTPAFFANWQTNTSNQMRVTTNQALIVATGAQVDGLDGPTDKALSKTFGSTNPPGLDALHANSASCIGCHEQLDPTRSILAATYSWNYHSQTDPLETSQPGEFIFRNVFKPVTSVYDFAATLAQHPLFATGWTEKLCYYATSTSCGPSEAALALTEPIDPEFTRIVNVFANSGFSWNALVTELLSSPITTNATLTPTRLPVAQGGEGEVVAVSRRDHLCAALNNRLGFTDLCGLDPQDVTPQTPITEIVPGLPSDGYGRGGTAPVLPNTPTLFFRAGTENICEAAAGLVIDVPTGKQLPNVKQWSSAQPGAAIADFVQLIMGLPPSDPRSAQAKQVLTAHYNDAIVANASHTSALQSTFMAACLAPSSVGIGM